MQEGSAGPIRTKQGSPRAGVSQAGIWQGGLTEIKRRAYRVVVLATPNPYGKFPVFLEDVGGVGDARSEGRAPSNGSLLLRD